MDGCWTSNKSTVNIIRIRFRAAVASFETSPINTHITSNITGKDEFCDCPGETAYFIWQQNGVIQSSTGLHIYILYIFCGFEEIRGLSSSGHGKGSLFLSINLERVVKASIAVIRLAHYINTVTCLNMGMIIKYLNSSRHFFSASRSLV